MGGGGGAGGGCAWMLRWCSRHIGSKRRRTGGLDKVASRSIIFSAATLRGVRRAGGRWTGNLNEQELATVTPL